MTRLGDEITSAPNTLADWSDDDLRVAAELARADAGKFAGGYHPEIAASYLNDADRYIAELSRRRSRAMILDLANAAGC